MTSGCPRPGREHGRVLRCSTPRPTSTPTWPVPRKQGRRLPIVIGLEVDYYEGRMDDVAGLLAGYPSTSCWARCTGWAAALDDIDDPASMAEWWCAGLMLLEAYTEALEELAVVGACDVLAPRTSLRRRATSPTPGRVGWSGSPGGWPGMAAEVSSPLAQAGREQYRCSARGLRRRGGALTTARTPPARAVTARAGPAAVLDRRGTDACRAIAPAATRIRCGRAAGEMHSCPRRPSWP